MSFDFSDKDVVVTGGTGGLGVAVVQVLVEGGAMVHVPAHRVPEAGRFALAGHPRVRVVAPVDLGDEGAVRAFYESVPGLWASVHVAGGFLAGGIVETALGDFRKMMETNAVTCFLCCREAVRQMRSAGNGGGRIVNVSAKGAVVAGGGTSAYAASKAAVANLTLSLSEELRGEGIWVNAVLPSIMDTPANRQMMPQADFGKWAKVSEVAEVIVFLASAGNGVTSGGLVPVYGRG